MSDKDHTINYRGAKLNEQDQEKIKAEKAAHKNDVSHVHYRGAEADVKLNEEHKKHQSHIQYRGAEDDMDV